MAEVFADPAAVTRAAAEMVVELAAKAVAAHGRFAVALAGGSTPKALYELLATAEYARRIDWPRTHVFFGDERCVPPTDPQSNERMARRALLDHVALPAENVHPMRCTPDDAAGAAAAYERELRSFFSAASADEPGDGVPAGAREPGRTFDLVLLGLGTNGHTASLFPGLSAVHEAQRWVVAQFVAEVGQWRMTLTVPAVNAAADIAFVVTGAEKAAVLRRVVEGRRDVDVTPAQAIAPHTGGRLRWLVDAAAAAELKEAVSS
jgi:6-phosphogluconolactonase